MVAPTIKLQAYLAHAGIASRRKAEDFIADHLVTVNGESAHIGQRITPGTDSVTFKGKSVDAQTEPVYILVNKPLHIVSTTSDELHRPTVLSLLPKELKTQRLYPVGRLDHDSQGLMLLTNNGDVAYKLTHPKFKVPKTYLVKLDREPSNMALEHLRRGVKLSEGFTAPAEVELADDSYPIDQHTDRWFTITIHEGRNRQVRRMFERVGYEVLTLMRVSIGPLNVDQLSEEMYHVMTAEEVEELRKFVGSSS